jgi:hypothetical protein
VRSLNKYFKKKKKKKRHFPCTSREKMRGKKKKKTPNFRNFYSTEENHGIYFHESKTS